MISDQLQASLVGRYTIERELGRGGMATVYLAEDMRHRRKVAVKVLHPELSAVLGPERFLKEIELTASLQHPHILPLFDSGSADGQLFYVMPFVQGETLRARLDRETQLPVDDAVRIARETAEALQYAHERGIVHRDVKPENILLQGGHALVADFGIALAVQQAGGQRMTQTGLSLGTPQYMAPEQAAGEKNVDARADVYALGAVTYEMLVGEAPFTGPSVQAIVARVMTEEPRSLTLQRKAIPGAVEDAVLRALEKLPADRFSTAGDFGAALDPRATSTTRATRAQPTTRRDKWLVGSTSVFAIAMTGLALWGWLRPQPSAGVIRYRISLDSVVGVRNWTGDVAISPDGSVLVHTGGPNGALLMRRRNELTFRPMPATEGAISPFFSPDGSQVGFFADGKLMTVAPAGGPPTVLVDSLIIPDAYVWGADGYIYGTRQQNGLWVLARGKALRGAWQAFSTLDTAAGEFSHLMPDILPNGKTVLFQLAYRDGRRVIGAADIASGRHTVLMPGIRARYSRDGHLLYTTIDGKLWSVSFDQNTLKAIGTPVLLTEGIPSTVVGPVEFAVSASGTLVYAVEDPTARRELIWVSRNGARASLDSAWRGTFASPALSPDGTKLAVTVRDASSSDVWIKRVSGGAAVKLTVENKSNDEPAWTPDGRAVTYISGLSSVSVGDVYRQPADGSDKGVPILHLDRPISEQMWSRAGDWLLVRTTTSTAGAGDILGARRGPQLTAVPIVATRNSEYSPTLSPDGRWMAYASNETGRLEVFVVPFPNPGTAKRQISSKGGMLPRWSRRGGELFYIDAQSNLMAAQVTTSPTFSLQGTTLLFSVADFVLGGVSRRNYDVSPDDQHFLMVRRAPGALGSQLVVVENWIEEQKKTAR
jgi:tRNA A-37 threonylcarbamoyl transferase component Bud32